MYVKVAGQAWTPVLQDLLDHFLEPLVLVLDSFQVVLEILM